MIAELGGHLVMQTAQEIGVTEDVDVDVCVTSMSPNKQQYATIGASTKQAFPPRLSDLSFLFFLSFLVAFLRFLSSRPAEPI